jgi:hypothetical protein
MGTILSEARFDSLDISDETKKAIQEMGFEQMTEVQARTIPPLLEACSFVVVVFFMDGFPDYFCYVGARCFGSCSNGLW